MSIWARFAAFLSFTAILLALVAPASMLAQELRTGKLGGICSLNFVSGQTFSTALSHAFAGADNNLSNPADTPEQGSHCELCGSLGLVLPLLLVATIGPFSGPEFAAFFVPPPAAPSNPGLPFSRGPPTL